MIKRFIIVYLILISAFARAQIIDTLCINNPNGRYGVSGYAGSIFFWSVEGGNLTSVNGDDSVYVHWDVTAPNHNLSVFEITKDGCVGDSVHGSVVFRTNPLLAIGGTDSACLGSKVVLFGIGGIEYNWNTGDTTSSIEFDIQKDTSIYFYGTDGCGYDTVFHFIKALPVPVSNIDIRPDKPMVNKAALLTSVGQGATSFIWNLNGEYLANQGPQLWHTFKNEGDYSLQLIVGNNYLCTDTSEIDFEVRRGMITAFSPNSDGVNDFWIIEELVNFPNCHITVFDKWGGMVFESYGYSVPWDGKKDGESLPAGSYSYLLDYGDGKEIVKGTVTIIL